MYDQKLGDRIKTLLEGRGLSLQKVADFVGTSKNSVYKWETGQANPHAFAIDSSMVEQESTSVARPGIVDADYALESAKLAKQQVLQESSSKMLSASLTSVQLVSKLLDSL